MKIGPAMTPRNAIFACLILLIVLGAIHTRLATLPLWGADSDIADPVLIWQGIHLHGIGFLQNWRYTGDNWLLSLIPIDFLLFALAGHAPIILLLIGLGIFYAIILLVYLIIDAECGRLAALASAAVLLFTGRPALGADGFLTYPISHGITLAWGLLGLLCAARWLRTPDKKWLIASGISLYIGCQSDPWGTFAFLLPMMLGSVALLVFHRADRVGAEWRALRAVILMGLVVIGLIITRFFGILLFLLGPPHHFAPISAMLQRALIALRYIPVFFNVIPGSLTTTGTTPTHLITGIDTAILLTLLGITGVKFCRATTSLSLTRKFLALTSIISLGLMVAALIGSDFPLNMATARYLSNFFVFVPILIAIGWSGVPLYSPRGAALISIIAAGSIIAGLVSNQLTLRPTIPRNGIPALAKFLTAHHLSFGYGPYWPTEANAMNWVSNGAVTIRPIVYDRQSGRFIPKGILTLQAWYQHPNSGPKSFLIVQTQANSCGTKITCISAAERQFGQPSRLLPYRSLSILVFDHPLRF